jgi:hypothetical protein
MKRIVKLVAVDKRYKETAYPHQCIFDDNINNYLTGQHFDPRKPETVGFLTLDEMTGKVQLSPEKALKFPFVINPIPRIAFENGKKYDLSTDKQGNYINPRDAAYVKLLSDHTWYVAKTKDEVIPGKHYFYLHDEIKEAEKRVESSDLSYRAEKLVREKLTDDGIFDLALVLQYKIQSFKFNEHDYNKIVLKDMVLQQCKTNPKIVLEADGPSYKDDIFVLKLALHKILTRKGTDFYDGAEFLGSNLIELKAEIRKEARTAQVSKWNRLLAEKENRLSSSNGEAVSQTKKEVYDTIKDMNVEELKKYAGSKRYSKADWGELDTKEELIQFLISKVN